MGFSRAVLSVGAMLLVTLVIGGTWAFAHGGDPDQVHSCVNDESGSVRVVAPDGECSKKETLAFIKEGS